MRAPVNLLKIEPQSCLSKKFKSAEGTMLLSDREKTLEIDGDRLWRDLMTSATIGPGKGNGLSRLTLTDDDKTMRDCFVRWCEEAGCTVAVDRVGNIFASRPGKDNSLPAVLVGSHLDTQVAGGKYDGILGVLSGLEIIRTLNDHAIETKRPIKVVCWTNEEGVRFQPPMMGAGTFAGIHSIDWVLEQKDDRGLVFGEELRRIGYAGATESGAEQIDSYFELHIEQGAILDDEGIHVGIVTGGFTSYGAELRIRGETAHSGPTPMRQRRNALVGAAKIIADLNDIGWDYEPDGRTACSRIEVFPNKYGILPDFAQITIDIRHPDGQKAKEMYDKALALIPSASKRANVDINIVKEWTFGDVVFDPDLINLVRSVAADLKVSHKHMLSATGHDAYHIAKKVPAALIFTPCKNGVTHNENEHIEPHYTTPGVNVLLHSVLHRANS
jgi:beta-ureidopropionase / N-carbamoyl-L-amino-acid hydrolase